MTWTEVVAIIILTPVTLLAALAWAVGKQWWRRGPSVRSQAQDDTVVLMTDWITDQHILKAAYDTGTLTAIGQQKLLYELGDMSEKQLAVCVGKFLSNRKVRQAVSVRMSKQTNFSRDECMEKLGRMAENMKQMEKGLFRE